MLLSNAAARLKLGACETMPHPDSRVVRQRQPLGGSNWLDPFISRASGVSPGCNNGSAAQMGQRRHADPTLHARTLNMTAMIAVGRGFRAR
jgi:hypothetical protein